MDIFIYILLGLLAVAFVTSLIDDDARWGIVASVMCVVLISILFAVHTFVTPTLMTTYSEEKYILGISEESFGDVKIISTKYQVRCSVEVTQDFPGMWVMGATLKESVKGRCYENPGVGEVEKSLKLKLTTNKEGAR
jgi:hypothetical protein